MTCTKDLTDSVDIYLVSPLTGGTFDGWVVSYQLVTAREVEL